MLLPHTVGASAELGGFAPVEIFTLPDVHGITITGKLCCSGEQHIPGEKTMGNLGPLSTLALLPVSYQL